MFVVCRALCWALRHNKEKEKQVPCPHKACSPEGEILSSAFSQNLVGGNSGGKGQQFISTYSALSTCCFSKCGGDTDMGGTQTWPEMVHKPQ